MRRHAFFWGTSGLVCAIAVLLAGGVAASSAAAQAAVATPQRPAPVTAVAAMKPACPRPRPGFMQCFALYEPQTGVNRALAAGLAGPAATPTGLSPASIVSAYKLPISQGSGQTVAVVEAYSTPDLASDLATYRTEYNLPACTTASGCLKIVNQQGETAPLPHSGVPYGWDVETMLDVSMVSAACPQCKILVVEATNESDANLATAEDTAASLGAEVISNSYGQRENGKAQRYAPAYDHQGHTIVVSSGDAGYTAANFPANLSTVTAVGGTELTSAKNSRGWTEQVWNVWNTGAGASGSGCSAYVPKPSWQTDPHCPGRTVADVSAVAWNIPVYDSSQGGWLSVGGTSAAAPLIAGVYALAGNATTIAPGYEYSHSRSLFDIVTGNNIAQSSCGRDYLCRAKKGYDAPSGLGTPDGAGAF
jgi:subtilase family serine protease